jgi:hypothetical protein
MHAEEALGLYLETFDELRGIYCLRNRVPDNLRAAVGSPTLGGTSRRTAPVAKIYRLQVSRYLWQLPSPSSPNSSLWRHASRNSSHSRCQDRSRPMRTPPGPISIPGTSKPCEKVEEGKAQRAAAAMPSAYTRIKILPMSEF